MPTTAVVGAALAASRDLQHQQHAPHSEVRGRLGAHRPPLHQAGRHAAAAHTLPAVPEALPADDLPVPLVVGAPTEPIDVVVAAPHRSGHHHRQHHHHLHHYGAEDAESHDGDLDHDHHGSPLSSSVFSRSSSFDSAASSFGGPLGRLSQRSSLDIDDHYHHHDALYTQNEQQHAHAGHHVGGRHAAHHQHHHRVSGSGGAAAPAAGADAAKVGPQHSAHPATPLHHMHLPPHCHPARPAAPAAAPAVPADLATCHLGRRVLTAEEASSLKAAFKAAKPPEHKLPSARHVRHLGRGGVGDVSLLELQLPGGGRPLRLAQKVGHCRRYDAARHAREVAALELCSPGCPYVLRLYGKTRGAKPPFALYTEYCPGGSLADLLERRRRSRGRGGPYFDEAEVRWLAARIVCSLKHVHEQRLVHRDVKAANIYLTALGTPLLADFDMAAPLDGDGYVYGAAGSIATAAPEVRAAAYDGCGGPYDGRADMWSLGMVLLGTLTDGEPCDGPAVLGGGRASEALQDLLLGGLLVHQSKRLRSDEAAQHAFFSGVAWDALEAEAPPASLTEDLQADDAAA